MKWLAIHDKCGQQVNAVLNSITSGKGCCKTCGIASRAEKLRFSAAEAIEVMRTFSLEPLEEYPGYFEKWRCLHTKCGREVTPTFWYVKFRESGCKYCATRGMDYSGPGIVYLLERADYFAAKIGITTPNSRTDRIATHIKDGWNLVTSWTTETVSEAEDVEQEILKWWRVDLDAPIAMQRGDMKSGWTETASLLYVDTEETCRRVERILADRQAPEFGTN